MPNGVTNGNGIGALRDLVKQWPLGAVVVIVMVVFFYFGDRIMLRQQEYGERILDRQAATNAIIERNTIAMSRVAAVLEKCEKHMGIEARRRDDSN